MNRSRIAFLIGFVLWSGCARQSPPPAVSSPDGDRQVSIPLVEEFDPQSLDEDLLLIMPNFAPPVGQSGPALAPAVSEASRIAVSDKTIEVGSRVYRIQLMALADGGVAEERRQALARQLGVPVRLEESHDLFLIWAGAFPTAAQAERFKVQLAALNPEYADSYVVVDDKTADLVDLPTFLTIPAPETTEEPKLVPAIGWRIRLDKVDSYPQAESFRASAVRDLRRTDIDITFTAPYYNIEAGHYRTEVEAQEALERLRRRYPYALKVRGRILIPEEE